MKLSRKQKAFLGYISRYKEEWGQSPSFDEICAHFGFNSYNTVTTYLKILKRKGYIRIPGKRPTVRTIRVSTDDHSMPRKPLACGLSICRATSLPLS